MYGALIATQGLIFRSPLPPSDRSPPTRGRGGKPASTSQPSSRLKKSCEVTPTHFDSAAEDLSGARMTKLPAGHDLNFDCLEMTRSGLTHTAAAALLTTICQRRVISGLLERNQSTSNYFQGTIRGAKSGIPYQIRHSTWKGNVV